VESNDPSQNIPDLLNDSLNISSCLDVASEQQDIRQVKCAATKQIMTQFLNFESKRAATHRGETKAVGLP
jgi:hypothetical protein